MLANPRDYRQPSPTSRAGTACLATICSGVGRKAHSAFRRFPITTGGMRSAFPPYTPRGRLRGIIASPVGLSSEPQRTHLAKVNVTLPVSSSAMNITGTPRPSSQTMYRGAAVYLEFDGGNGGSIDLYDRLLPLPIRTCSIRPESGRIIVLEWRKLADHGLAG